MLRQAVESGIVTLYRETLIGRYLERELTREEAVDELGVAAVDELDVAAVDELDAAGRGHRSRRRLEGGRSECD